MSTGRAARAVGVLGLLLAACGLGAATPGVDVPPLAQPPSTIVLPAMHESRLANGLTLIVVPRPGQTVNGVARIKPIGPHNVAQNIAATMTASAERPVLDP